jgi:hypothetical protein
VQYIDVIVGGPGTQELEICRLQHIPKEQLGRPKKDWMHEQLIFIDQAYPSQVLHCIRASVDHNVLPRFFLQLSDPLFHIVIDYDHRRKLAPLGILQRL